MHFRGGLTYIPPLNDVFWQNLTNISNKLCAFSEHNKFKENDFHRKRKKIYKNLLQRYTSSKSISLNLELRSHC